MDILIRVLSFTNFTIILHANGDLCIPAIRHGARSLYMSDRLMQAPMRQDSQGHYILVTRKSKAKTQSAIDWQRAVNPLLADIAQHRAASAGHIAYVVPMEKVWQEETRPDRKCVVVPLPGITSAEIAYDDEVLHSEVRRLPDGSFLQCVMVANERIALSGVAVREARAKQEGWLVILWLFDDKAVFSKHRFDEDLSDEMWCASHVAEEYNAYGPDKNFKPQSADHRGLFYVSSVFQAIYPSQSGV
jgi:hypothetical protein